MDEEGNTEVDETGDDLDIDDLDLEQLEELPDNDEDQH